MDNAPVVEIGMGKHSMKVPSGTQALFEQLFALSGFGPKDFFTVRIGKGVKSTAHSPLVNVKVPVHNTNSVVVELKPGNNGTRFEYYVSMPRGYKGTLETFFHRLQHGEKKMLRSCNILRSKEKKSLPESGISLSDRHKEGVSPVEIAVTNFASLDLDELAPPPQTDHSPLAAPKAEKKYRRVKDIIDGTLLALLVNEIYHAESQLNYADMIRLIDSQDLNCESRQVLKHLEDSGYLERKDTGNRCVLFSLTKQALELIGACEKEEEEMQMSKEAKRLEEIRSAAEKYSAMAEEINTVDEEIKKIDSQISGLEAKRANLLSSKETLTASIPAELVAAHETWAKISPFLQ